MTILRKWKLSKKMIQHKIYNLIIETIQNLNDIKIHILESKFSANEQVKLCQLSFRIQRLGPTV